MGLPEDDLMQIEEKLSNFIYDHGSPVIVPEISIVDIDEKYLIKVQIYRGNNLPYFLNPKEKKRVYISG